MASTAATFNETFYLSQNADVVLAISQGFFAMAMAKYLLYLCIRERMVDH